LGRYGVRVRPFGSRAFQGAFSHLYDSRKPIRVRVRVRVRFTHMILVSRDVECRIPAFKILNVQGIPGAFSREEA